MAHAIVLKPGTHNALELNFPHAYKCRLAGYYHDQSLMVVAVAPDQDTHLDEFFIVFESVQYFDGALFWNGANLRVANEDELFDFSMKKSLVVTTEELCIFEAENQQIRLLAGAWIAILDELPARFR